MSPFNASRRQFLRTASVVSGSVGAAGAPFALNLASLGTAVAQTAPDYKAIVCLFLYGGNDSSNMILRTDTASFAEYTRMRATGQDPIALLAPGTPASGVTPTPTNQAQIDAAKRDRVYLAVFLSMASPDYLIQK